MICLRHWVNLPRNSQRRKTPKKLIETVSEAICDKILDLSGNIKRAEVSLTKIKPPIDGDVEKVKVVIAKKR